MSGMLRKCCPPVCCTGDEWTCDEDLVEFDVTVKHTVEQYRDLNIDITNCNWGTLPPHCNLGQGYRYGHIEPMNLLIEYECRFKVYMTPPSGTYTNLYNLGTWVQSDACAPSWLANPTLGGTGPRVRGTWTANSTIINKYPQSTSPPSTNCDNMLKGETELDIDIDFVYDEPSGTIPPADILSVVKLRNLPENHGTSVDCCTGIKTSGCDDRCLLDLQVAPGSIRVEMLNGAITQEGAGRAVREIVSEFLNEAPPCTGRAVLSDQALPLILDDFGDPKKFTFYTAARKVWDGKTAITCDPNMTEGKAVAAVDSQMNLTWQEVLILCRAAMVDLSSYPPNLPGNSSPYGFYDTQSGSQSRFSQVNTGYKLATSNVTNVILASDDFYSATGCLPTLLSPPKVVCVPGDTEHNECDSVNDIGEFPLPYPGDPGICPKYKFNLINGWKDHIWEYAYLADFDACWPTECECDSGGNTSGYSGIVDDSSIDEVRGKVKTSIIVNGITPEPSTDCPQ